MNNTRNDITRQMASCTHNDGYPASLEVRKVYEVLPDAAAATHNLVSVIDESGEDYLYPAYYFVPIELPEAVTEALFITV